ncbi:hypothetical protein BC829DRAFT_420946 [Chytridium lagenaria]|nr:hypothetical protein BC829DRAFT_420946 [Chytridium lagenaria]
MACRVYIFQATEDPATSEWKEIQDLSDDIATFCVSEERVIYTDQYKLETFESTCISWSEQDLYPSGGSAFPFVQLAVGSKSGVVTFWSLDFSPEERKLLYHSFITPATCWITNLEWSQWSKQDTRYNVGTGDGHVEDRKLAICVGVFVLVAVVSMEPDSPPENDILSHYLLPIGMSITVSHLNPKGVVWSCNGEYFRVYSEDGIALTIDISKTYELSILDDITQTVYESILEGRAPSAIEMQGEYGVGTALGDKTLRFFGACSVNGVVDVLACGLNSKNDLGYRTEKDYFTIMALFKNYVVGDEETESLFVDLMHDALNDPYQLTKYTTNYVMFEIVDYCISAVNTMETLPTFPLKAAFWLYDKFVKSEDEFVERLQGEVTWYAHLLIGIEVKKII